MTTCVLQLLFVASMGLGREHCHCRRREHDHRSPNSSKPNMAYGPQSECVIAAHNTDTQQLHLIQYGWPDSQAISIQSIRLWPPTFVRIEIAQFCEWHTRWRWWHTWECVCLCGAPRMCISMPTCDEASMTIAHYQHYCNWSWNLLA